MDTRRLQSEFYRRISLTLSGALIALASLTALPIQAADDSVPNSGYSPVNGEQFFLLSDTSYGSDEEARVRLEAPGRDYRRYSMEAYGGADVRVYRLEHPLEFLKHQKNLHRVREGGRFQGEGLSNTLAYLWDNWYKKSRRAMQRAFSPEARSQVIEEAPELKMGEAINAPTHFTPQIQYAQIPGLPMVQEFRYPLWDAKPIEPPKETRLAGSSSEFISPAEGNVYIPLGKLKPGLYLVEALVGKFRATTVVFVSNTVAVTKIAGNELLVWTATKRDGKAVPKTKLLWSDGLGILSSGESDTSGLLRLEHTSPERSYVIGEDSEGGVFVSENFYYDSEIYDTKLYAFTDRPLYRPGDWVELKILGREFLNARDSKNPDAAPIDLTVLDANGTELQNLKLDLDPVSGSAGRFQLPENATAGGYELRFSYRDQVYSAAFRVADYIKPHFEIGVELAKPEFKTGEPVKANLHLVYPDGKPVANAHLELSLRSQQLSMVDHELRYLGQFPVELTTSIASSDANGLVPVELPAADKPSRYVLTVFASDGAAYRVKTSKEILIERGVAQYSVDAAQRFSAVGDPVSFAFHAENDDPAKPASFHWVRLEDQSTGDGTIAPDSDHFTIVFDKPGNYTISLSDERHFILGGTSHSVSGEGVKTSAGSVAILFNQTEYHPGDTAEALITFPEPVDEALLSLERDKVEATSLLSAPESWLSLERLNETQYRAKIPVKDDFAPNLTFSVLYTKNGEYSFQNAGIKVAFPEIAVKVSTDKENYQPGDEVVVKLQTRLGDKPLASAHLTVSVVDEMIYALQPEIAPTIGEFFYHPRRNNVRTSASLSFISYDVALPGSATPPGASNRSDRGVKVLERPRREDKDTAAWIPDLVTDAEGNAEFHFTVPDSLTRWRITARAITAEGFVGQRRQFLRSDKPLYLKWTGPTLYRVGDKPVQGLLAFNQTQDTLTADFVYGQNGQEQKDSVTLHPGVNYLPIQLSNLAVGEMNLRLERDGKVQDSLSVALREAAPGWTREHSQVMNLNANKTPLVLPTDARNLQVSLGDDPDSLFRASLDDLLDYPWGCVEQTASRLLPLSIAYPQLAKTDARIRDRLRLILQNSRLRLVFLAGPKASFSWWGGEEEDAFLTAYAYYADWYASQALGLELPPEHWQHVLDVYSQQADRLPLLHRALIVSFAKDMDLPVNTLVQGLMEDRSPGGNDVDTDGSSLVFMAPDSTLGRAAAHLLIGRLAEAGKLPMSPAFKTAYSDAEAALASHPSPFLNVLSHFGQAQTADKVGSEVAELGPEYPTMERALALLWLYRDSRVSASELGGLPSLTGTWTADKEHPGRWQWSGATLPNELVLSDSPAKPLTARVRYLSTLPSANNVPVTIERHLWRLVPGTESFSFQAEPVTDGKLSSDELYLDEIRLNGTGDKPVRYSLLEVPLPPGADVEKTTWGISISGLGGTEAQTLEKARSEPGQLSYAVPIDGLQGEMVLRHLVRFSQKGEFHLPAARLYRMYAPEQATEEAKPALADAHVE